MQRRTARTFFVKDKVFRNLECLAEPEHRWSFCKQFECMAHHFSSTIQTLHRPHRVAQYSSNHKHKLIDCRNGSWFLITSYKPKVSNMHAILEWCVLYIHSTRSPGSNGDLLLANELSSICFSTKPLRYFCCVPVMHCAVTPNAYKSSKRPPGNTDFVQCGSL